MPYNPEKHHRRSIRLKGYDYSKKGAYFITICCQNRQCLFGKIEHGNMILNNAGKMVQTTWNDLPIYYNGIAIDAFQIMPNHIHGIIYITDVFAVGAVGAGPRACPACPQQNQGQPQGVAPTKLSLSDCVHRFKTMTTKRYIDGIKINAWQSINGKLWQRNYFEHIIRNENSMDKIREYISNNPLQWDSDEFNPFNNN